MPRRHSRAAVGRVDLRRPTTGRPHRRRVHRATTQGRAGGAAAARSPPTAARARNAQRTADRGARRPAREGRRPQAVAAEGRAAKAAAEQAAAATPQRKRVIANAQQDPKAAARHADARLRLRPRASGPASSASGSARAAGTTRPTNPSSGAYGIPQSLPGSKMATVAADYRTNPVTQIKWGLGYIKRSYGTPVQRPGPVARALPALVLTGSAVRVAGDGGSADGGSDLAQPDPGHRVVGALGEHQRGAAPGRAGCSRPGWAR